MIPWKIVYLGGLPLSPKIETSSRVTYQEVRSDYRELLMEGGGNFALTIPTE